MPAKVLGIGSAVVDRIAFVSYEEQEAMAPGKGGAVPLEEQDFLALKDKLNFKEAYPGGSTVNTLKGLSLLGQSCAFLGLIGNDSAKKLFEEGLNKRRISYYLTESAHPSTQVLSLITPDRDRTMRSFLGAAKDFNLDSLKDEAFENISHCHLEGYLLYYPDVVETAMEMAKERGATVSINLASYEVVDAFKERLAYLLERWTDVVFASEAEAKSFTGLEAEEASKLLAEIVPFAVVTKGEKGAYSCHKNWIEYMPAEKTPVVDTTGAGDFFAAGYLDAFLKKATSKEALYSGAKLAAQVCAILGTDLFFSDIET